MLILKSAIAFIIFLYYLRTIYIDTRHSNSEARLLKRYQYLLRKWEITREMMYSDNVNTQSDHLAYVLWDLDKQFQEFTDEASRFPALQRERGDILEKNAICLDNLCIITQAKLQKTSY